MTKAEAGKVYLVGAGPGDPELLTRKAAALLESADVILHDDLVPPQILSLAGPRTLVASVGKRCGKKKISQATIHSLMITCARKGMSVVRLKSGDPTIFGRAGEEIDALKSAGIPVEIVPGISAAFAAAAAAHISLTDRCKASRVTFATGHLAESEGEINYWDQIAQAGTTLVIYMPGLDLGALAARLHAAGLTAETPCLLVSRASHENQREQRGALADLKNMGALEPPSVLIVGEVARERVKDTALVPELTEESSLFNESTLEAIIQKGDS
jgi:uroporphyrin-III C-methyltransferase